jgi:hypothetical protein
MAMTDLNTKTSFSQIGHESAKLSDGLRLLCSGWLASELNSAGTAIAIGHT